MVKIHGHIQWYAQQSWERNRAKDAIRLVCEHPWMLKIKIPPISGSPGQTFNFIELGEYVKEEGHPYLVSLLWCEPEQKRR